MPPLCPGSRRVLEHRGAPAEPSEAGRQVDGTLVPADLLDASGVTDAVVLLPAAAAADFLLRLQADEPLQARVQAVLVESGASRPKPKTLNCKPCSSWPHVMS